MLHTPETCCLDCVSRVCSLGMRHVSPPHCRSTRCPETRLSSPLSLYTVLGDTSLLPTVTLHGARRHVSPPHCHTARCRETRLSCPLSGYTAHGDTSLLPTVALHGAWRHVSPPHCHTTRRHVSPAHCHTTRCPETRLSSPLSLYTVHGDTSLLPTVTLHGDTSLLPTVALHGAWRNVSPPHCRATRCPETRLSCPMWRYTVHGDTTLVPEGCVRTDVTVSL